MITDSHDNILISTSLSLLKQHKKIHHYSFLVTVSLFVLLIAYCFEYYTTDNIVMVISTDRCNNIRFI